MLGKKSLVVDIVEMAVYYPLLSGEELNRLKSNGLSRDEMVEICKRLNIVFVEGLPMHSILLYILMHTPSLFFVSKQIISYPTFPYFYRTLIAPFTEDTLSHHGLRHTTTLHVTQQLNTIITLLNSLIKNQY